jgi:hypothetical protein
MQLLPLGCRQTNLQQLLPIGYTLQSTLGNGGNSTKKEKLPTHTE